MIKMTIGSGATLTESAFGLGFGLCVGLAFVVGLASVVGLGFALGLVSVVGLGISGFVFGVKTSPLWKILTFVKLRT